MAYATITVDINVDLPDDWGTMSKQNQLAWETATLLQYDTALADGGFDDFVTRDVEYFTDDDDGCGEN